MFDMNQDVKSLIEVLFVILLAISVMFVFVGGIILLSALAENMLGEPCPPCEVEPNVTDDPDDDYGGVLIIDDDYDPWEEFDEHWKDLYWDNDTILGSDMIPCCEVITNKSQECGYCYEVDCPCAINTSTP